MSPNIILGIESSCDETSAAVVADGRRVLSNLVSSQTDLHAKYGGVVPEIASRAHIERIQPIIAEALRQAGVTRHDVDGIAVTIGPGLVGSLLVGVTAAKTLAWGWNKPLVGVDHIEAHATSAALGSYELVVKSNELKVGDDSRGRSNDDGGERGDSQNARRRDPPLVTLNSLLLTPWPAVALVVSGGHTSLYLVRDFLDIALLGETIDDAAGEAFDKVAAILELGFPGGPAVDRLAKDGDAAAVRFPRTWLEPDSLNFSFSGLKTAVLYHVYGAGKKYGSVAHLHRRELADIAASFTAALVEVLVTKTVAAAKRAGIGAVVVGGGVAANSALRAALAAACAQDGLKLHLTPLKYCTDNAAMIAALGYRRFMAGERLPLDAEPRSGLVRTARRG